MEFKQKKMCQGAGCDKKIYSDKTYAPAFVAGLCTECWRKTLEPREVTPRTQSQSMAFKSIDTTDPAWRARFLNRYEQEPTNPVYD